MEAMAVSVDSMDIDIDSPVAEGETVVVMVAPVSTIGSRFTPRAAHPLK
jgi:hypothetical protein